MSLVNSAIRLVRVDLSQARANSVFASTAFIKSGGLGLLSVFAGHALLLIA
jgi:hypothetical protein